METDKYIQEESMLGWIVKLFHRTMAVNYRKFTDLGIHPRQFPFLKVVSIQDGISQRDLAQAVHVKPPTVAVTVKRLEKAELIYRKPDPDDMRISRIYLTGKGRELSDYIDREMTTIENLLRNGFSEEELTRLREDFTRMADNLDRYDAGEKETKIKQDGGDEKKS